MIHQLASDNFPSYSSPSVSPSTDSSGAADSSDVFLVLVLLVAYSRECDVLTRVGDFDGDLVLGASAGHDHHIPAFDFRNPVP